MSVLAYNPADYDKDLRYLIGEHYDDVVAYKKWRFPENAFVLEIMMQNVTKGYIENMSNIYPAGVVYSGIDADKYRKMLRRKQKAMKEMERFYNLQKMALLWTYLVNDELYFMALDGSNYYIDYDAVGDVEAVIVRTGRFLDDQGETKYHFKLWRDGTVYHTIADDWTYISSDAGGWKQDEDNPSYDVLPFTLIKDRFIVQPAHSTLIGLENEIMAGIAFMIFAIYLSMLKKFYVASDGDGPAIQKMIKSMGIGTQALHFGKQGDTAGILDTGGTENHVNYYDIQQRILMQRAQIDGVDKQALFPDNKVESGVSRRLQMGMISQKREDRIVDWEEFEDNHWVLINALSKGSIPEPEAYIFNPLPNQLDPTEQVEIDFKTFDMLKQKYEELVITAEDYVRGSNPDADEAEVQERVNAIQGAETETVRRVPAEPEESEGELD